MNGISQVVPVQSYTLPTATQILRSAVGFYLKYWGVIVGAAVLPAIFSFANIFLGNDAPALVVLFGISAMITGIFSRLAILAIVTEGGRPEGGIRGAFIRGAHFLVPFAWVGIVSGLATAGGFFFFISPGVLLSIWLSLSVYVLFGERKQGIEALVASWHYVKGFWLPVLWRFLFLGMIFLVAGLILGGLGAGQVITETLKSGATEFTEVASPRPMLQVINLIFNNFIVFPLGIIYAYFIYRALREIKSAAPPEEKEERFRKAVKIFMLAGILGLIVLLALGGWLLATNLNKLLSYAPAGGETSVFGMLSYPMFSSSGVSPLIGLIFGK